MPAYQPNIPTGSVTLDQDWKNIQGNFQSLNITYSIDHYPYTDTSTKSGFHKKVTTPTSISDPDTTTNPTLYAIQQYSALGVLQYSRGPLNAAPTPITNINSPLTATIINFPNGTIDILDVTGFAFGIFNVYAVNAAPTPVNTAASATVFWNGTNFAASGLPAGSVIQIISSGSKLQLKNTSSTVPLLKVFWAIEVVRVK
jgi:hypothetical protein